MSIDSPPDWSPDPDIASLLRGEREDAGPYAGEATARMWKRLELHTVAAAGAGSLATAGAAGGSGAGAAGAGAASGAKALATKALGWKVGAASMLLLAGGAIGASLEARRSPPPERALSTVVAVERSHGIVDAPVVSAPSPVATTAESATVAVDVESLPRVPPSPVAVAHSGGSSAPRSSAVPSASSSASLSATTVGEEQRLLETARAAIARGAYSSAVTSLTEHQTRFPTGRHVEERELLFVQALAGLGDDKAAKARAQAFAERFPTSILLPAVRAVSATQER